MMPLWAPPPLWDEVSFRLTRGSKASLERVSQYDYVLGKGASIYDVRSGWGEGVPKKQVNRTKSADL